MLLHEPQKYKLFLYENQEHGDFIEVTVKMALPDIPQFVAKKYKRSCCFEVENEEGKMVLWKYCREEV